MKLKNCKNRSIIVIEVRIKVWGKDYMFYFVCYCLGYRVKNLENFFLKYCVFCNEWENVFG